MKEKSKVCYSKMFSKFAEDKKSLFIIVLGLFGIVLIGFSGGSEKEILSSDSNNYSDSNYIEDYEKQLESLISEVKGAGKVKVMITYESGYETVYAKDISEQSEDGRTKFSSEIIIVDSGSDENGVTVKEIYPTVRGVAVVCQGGGNLAVKAEIISIIKSLFNINSNCISVTEMKL